MPVAEDGGIQGGGGTQGTACRARQEGQMRPRADPGSLRVNNGVLHRSPAGETRGQSRRNGVEQNSRWNVLRLEGGAVGKKMSLRQNREQQGDPDGGVRGPETPGSVLSRGATEGPQHSMLVKIRGHGGKVLQDLGGAVADTRPGEQVSDQMVMWPAWWMDLLGLELTGQN